MIRFEWDPNKDHANRIKHRLSFETAVLVFDDPVALTILTRQHFIEPRRDKKNPRRSKGEFSA